MRNYFYLFACLFALPAFADECPALKPKNTLQDIIEIGLCRNPNTKMGYLSSESARLQKNSAYSKYLPTISASAETSATSADDFNKWGKNAGLSASLLIFDFGKRYSELSRLTAVWKATGFDYEESVQNYVYNIISSYYGLLSADADVKTNSDLLKVATDAKNTADTKFRAGVVAKADILRAETALASKKTDFQRSKGNREIAIAKLLSLLSLPQGTEINIVDMPANFGSLSETKNIEDLIDFAQKNRPDVLSESENVNAAWHNRNAVFTKHFPTISASGGLNYDLDTDMHSTRLGVTVSMPIFSGFADVYNDRVAMLNYERAKESEQAKRDSVALDVWTAFQNYKTASEVLESTNAQLKSARESERVVAGMYKVGRSTMLDWQTSQADLASAQKQNADAKYDLFIKRAALALAIGELRTGNDTDSVAE